MASDSEPTAAIVLAGGLGQRMQGQAKHRCLLGGRSLLELAIARTRAQLPRVLLSCNDRDLAAPEGVEAVLADSVGGFQGPLAGILAGLEYLAGKSGPHGLLLSVAVDTPWFPADLAERLATQRCARQVEIALAASGGFTHPVFALWPLELAAGLRALLESFEDGSVRGFQARHRCTSVEWPVGGVDPFLNINTPAELAAAERLLRDGKAPP